MSLFLSVPGSHLIAANSTVYCQSFDIASAAMRAAILHNFQRQLVIASADGSTIYGHHLPTPALRLLCGAEGYLTNGQILSRAIGCEAATHLQPVIMQVLNDRYDRSLVYAITDKDRYDRFNASVMHYVEDTVLIIIRRSGAFSIAAPLPADSKPGR